MHYVLLMSWTDAGIKKLKEEVLDADTGDGIPGLNDKLAAQLGLMNNSLVSFHWTVGPYSAVAVVEAASDVTVAGVTQWLTEDQLVTTTMMKAQDPNNPDPAAAPGTATFAGVLYRCYAGAD